MKTKREAQQAEKDAQQINLTNEQQLAVIALATQRQNIIDQANQQVESMNNAISEQARLIALSNGLPADGWTFGTAKDGSLVLVKKEKEEPGKGE